MFYGLLLTHIFVQSIHVMKNPTSINKCLFLAYMLGVFFKSLILKLILESRTFRGKNQRNNSKEQSH